MSILYTKMNSVLKIVIFILLLTVLINTEDSVKAASNSLIWPSEKEEVIVPQSGGVWYPRLLELENGDWLMSFDTNENSNYAEIKLIKSSNKGQTWGPPITVASEPGGNSANAQMLELENGDIWLAYRYVEETSGGFNTYLRVKVSHDNGDTWQDLPNGQIDEESSTEFKGVWEPHLEYIGNTIAVMYANDGPTAVGNTNWQNIIMKTWDGNSWSNPITVSDGVARGSRDGMPVWTQLESGEYILVYEASNTPGHPFVIEYKISTDGIDWSGPVKELYTPTGFGKKQAHHL